MEYYSEVRVAAKRALRSLGGLLERLPNGPVAPTKADLQRLATLRDSLGKTGIGLEAAFDELDDVLLPACVAISSPTYVGLLNTSPFPAAIAAELLIGALNNNAGAAHSAPAAVTVEAEVLRCLLDVVGWDLEADGQLVPGGTFANIHAILLARRVTLPLWDARGPVAVDRPVAVYASEASHFSVERAVRVAGLGTDGIRLIPSIGRGSLDMRALRDSVSRDMEDGVVPMAVVGTLGTTATGAIDPLTDIGSLCRDHGIWFHVDACYGGAALLLDGFEQQLDGLKMADSIAVDLHKWMFMPLACGALLTRHGRHDWDAFSPTDSSYVPQGADPMRDSFRRGLATSRRASAIGVWLALRAHGWNAVARGVRGSIGLARLLERRLSELGFDLLEGGQLSTACARWRPPGWSQSACDDLQHRIADEVTASGKAWFGTARAAGCTWLRFCIVNLTARPDDMVRLSDMVHAAATTLAQREYL